MRGAAAVVAERGTGAGPSGAVRCTTLRSDPPLTLRETPDGLHIVGSAAGPVGGDEIEFDIAVAAGASLSVRSVAAQLVYPGPTGEPSRWTTRATLGRDAALRWLPEPVVAVRGADHRAATHIKMDKGASLVWRDVAVLGRHGEASGSLRQRLRVEREGRPLVCTEVMLGPASPHAAGPAGTGGRRVIATLLVIGGGCSVATTLPTALGVRVGVCELADDAFLLTALSDSVERVMPVLAATAR